jgi:hypothetical protein
MDAFEIFLLSYIISHGAFREVFALQHSFGQGSEIVAFKDIKYE